jgi:hemoglobin
MSLYDQLGCEAGISTAVDKFYGRVLADPELIHYFADADMTRIRRHQVALLSTVRGGPKQYRGRGLDVAHRHLGITGEHFDRVVGHLGAALDDLGVSPEVRGQVAGVLVAQREAIVSAPETR